MSICENVILSEKNSGGYSLEIVAEFVDRFPVRYIIRVTTPKGVKADYVSTLEGFRNIGELLVALHFFAEKKLYSKNIEKLKEVLTAENIKNFAELLQSGKFSE